PFVSAPATNPQLLGSSALGRIDTGRFPSGNVVLAPRLGLSYDLRGSRPTQLRAGIGAFTGRPPVVWMGQAFLNTGRDQATLVCSPADGVPAPTTDVAALPQQCLTGTLGISPASVVYFDPGFRVPEALKALIGVDHDFGRGIRGSLDLLHTRTRNAIYLADVNLVPAGRNAERRMMYGTIDPIGNPVPARVDSAFSQVFRNSNRSGARSTALTLSLGKQWKNGGYLQLGYQWSRAEDYYSVEAPAADRSFANAPIDGTIADRRLTRSGFDVPHILTLAGVLPLPLGITVSGIFRLESGRPYAYVVRGDANADGAERGTGNAAPNDLIYVPRNPGDISLTVPADYSALDRFIAATPCLRAQRGRIMARNSCRNPRVTSLDVRFSKAVGIAGTQRLELGVDVFNLLNLIDQDWGLVREISDRETAPLLRVAGWDAAANRPVYAVPAAFPTATVTSLPWRMQLSARYRF
ncbi:MAG: hypothetical protein ABI742_10120, partial [Gemmatimonadota bacterium]